ncbi:hypothetical protein EJV47_01110 [Hymenobacter gummosus]|uniref:Uncharacterized protein n=1 Tax=Hymenobacter gummosus TaxID=1776032 RepID=A0A431U7W9_9BACT|nr:hypothetical protein EJV47_01110 [Hymenobacter gummosus]
MLPTRHSTLPTRFPALPTRYSVLTQHFSGLPTRFPALPIAFQQSSLASRSLHQATDRLRQLPGIFARLPTLFASFPEPALRYQPSSLPFRPSTPAHSLQPQGFPASTPAHPPIAALARLLPSEPYVARLCRAPTRAFRPIPPRSRIHGPRSSPRAPPSCEASPQPRRRPGQLP